MSHLPSLRQQFDARLAHVLELPTEVDFGVDDSPFCGTLDRLLDEHEAEDETQDVVEQEGDKRRWSDLYKTAVSAVGRRIADAFVADIARGTDPKKAIRLAGRRAAAVWKQTTAANDTAWLEHNMGMDAHDLQKKLAQHWRLSDAVRRGDAKAAVGDLLLMLNECFRDWYKPLLQLQAEEQEEERSGQVHDEAIELARRIAEVRQRPEGAQSRVECEQMLDQLRASQERLLSDPWWRVLRVIAPALRSMHLKPQDFLVDWGSFQGLWEQLEALAAELNELCLAPQPWLRLYKPQLDKEYPWSVAEPSPKRRKIAER